MSSAPSHSKNTFSVKKWIPRDGETFITKDGFIFYVFGYEHPKNRVLSFLKYVPAHLKPHFSIRFLRQKWKLGTIDVIRPERLYTPKNYQAILETFRSRFPQYVHLCPYRGKDVMSVPFKLFEKVFVPRVCLQRLVEKKRKDKLQQVALKLISLLSIESKIPLKDFGIHGSIALDMHNKRSDIDFVIYGSQNFRRLENVIEKLVKENVLHYTFTRKLDRARKLRGQYRDKRFVYNAVRKIHEITAQYGNWKYVPINQVTFSCEVTDDKQNMFRPAVYQIKNCHPLEPTSKLLEDQVPSTVVSMIGYYRNVAKCRDKIRVSGLLERVENVETRKTHYQVVIGSGLCEGEYLSLL